MELYDMNMQIQVVAAQLLADILRINGTDNSEATGEAVRIAFERLYSSNADCGSAPPVGGPSNATGCGGVGVGVGGDNKMSVLIPSLKEGELATLMWLVSTRISDEVNALRSKVYQLLLASQG